jgi:hypothetical protein
MYSYIGIAVMTIQHQKIISAILIAIVAFGGLEILAKIINLNQTEWFLKAGFAIWFYLALKIGILYDLHFKQPGALKRAIKKHESIEHWFVRSLKIVLSALLDRFSHLATKDHWLKFQNYLILPGILFWSTVILIYKNASPLTDRPLQQFFIFLSGTALVVAFWYLKEIFLRKTEKVESDVIAGLAIVKIYSAIIAYGAAFSIFRRFCLEPKLFVMAVFSLSFLLIYQALFQHKLVKFLNIFWTLIISGLMGIFGYFIYRFWAINPYTAMLVMGAMFNALWGILHYQLDGALTKKAFFETVLICLLLILMLASVTNFKERILNTCLY